MVSVRVDPVLVTRLDAMSCRPSLPHPAATVLAVVLSSCVFVSRTDRKEPQYIASSRVTSNE